MCLPVRRELKLKGFLKFKEGVNALVRMCLPVRRELKRYYDKMIIAKGAGSNVPSRS